MPLVWWAHAGSSVCVSGLLLFVLYRADEAARGSAVSYLCCTPMGVLDDISEVRVHTVFHQENPGRKHAVHTTFRYTLL